MKKIILIIIAIAVIISLLTCKVSDKQNLYTSVGGTLIAFLGAFLLYQIGIMIDEKAKKELRNKNTKYICQLYKMELEMNTRLIEKLISKRWLPFYKLKTITRDKLWGELADYSKDLDLMNKLNIAYGEFELINNKIDIMNSVRIHRKSTVIEQEKQELSKELEKQLDGSIHLGNNVLKVTKESIEILDKQINKTI